MFGRRFAFQFENGWGNEGPFPWQRREHFGPRMFMHMRGGPFARGPFGPHGPFGHEGHFGPGERQRFFGRGDMKFALLELLKERPMHGYEMIKALEEKSGGFYTPSPGSVYPTLQMLEDRGLVIARESDGKKVYSLTDAGQAFLNEHSQEAENFGPPWWQRARRDRRGHHLPEMQALRSESAEVARLFAIAARSSFQDPERISRLRAIIERTRKELSDLIYGSGDTTAEQPGTPTE